MGPRSPLMMMNDRKIGQRRLNVFSYYATVYLISKFYNDDIPLTYIALL